MRIIVLEINSASQLDDELPGPLVSDNKVKWAVRVALHNHNEPVRVIVEVNEDPLGLNSK